MFKFKKRLLTMAMVVVVGTLGLVGCSKEEAKAEKERLNITLVLTEGGVQDQSFNQSAWEGALSAKNEYDVEVDYIECKQKSEYASNIEMAIDNGSDLVIGVGFEMADAIKEAAENYPQQKFAVVDGSYDVTPDNVRSILFNEQEAGYAAGLVAGKMTETNKLGFIGGFDIPSVTNFAVGFEKGLKEVDSEMQLITQYANSFTDAAKGRVISEQMVKNGIDTIFVAAGGVNAGSIEVARETGIKIVGVDMASNHLAPDTIITSALKNVNEGVKLTIKDLLDGNFTGGQAVIYDLSNGGVGYEHTKHITDDIKGFVDRKISK